MLADLLGGAVDVLSREGLLLGDLRQADLLRGDLEALDTGGGDGLRAQQEARKSFEPAAAGKLAQPPDGSLDPASQLGDVDCQGERAFHKQIRAVRAVRPSPPVRAGRGGVGRVPGGVLPLGHFHSLTSG
jgi:hypothetical protein